MHRNMFKIQDGVAIVEKLNYAIAQEGFQNTFNTVSSLSDKKTCISMQGKN